MQKASPFNIGATALVFDRGKSIRTAPTAGDEMELETPSESGSTGTVRCVMERDSNHDVQSYETYIRTEKTDVMRWEAWRVSSSSLRGRSRGRVDVEKA